MRVLLQRVSHASVTVDSSVTGEIKNGFLILAGVEEADSEEDVTWLVKKICSLRVFSDDNGKMNLSLLDVGGSALVVSQFTLHASTKKGNRPSFIKAARPDHAEKLYLDLVKQLKSNGVIRVETGVFGAHMDVSLTNDGPVTIWIDSKARE